MTAQILHVTRLAVRDRALGGAQQGSWVDCLSRTTSAMPFNLQTRALAPPPLTGDREMTPGFHAGLEDARNGRLPRFDLNRPNPCQHVGHPHPNYRTDYIAGYKSARHQ